MKQPVVLAILDGWGLAEPGPYNAISAADTPFYDSIVKEYPQAKLSASSSNVGLPQGQMGNSEVGHMTIGAGRPVLQSLPRINAAITADGLHGNETLTKAFEAVSNANTLHLWGLLSDGGVHSHREHFIALIKMAQQKGVQNLAVHAVLDGRDTAPKSAESSLALIQQCLHDCGYKGISDICGRYWAMDRDTRWDRTERAWRLYTQGQGQTATEPTFALQESYAAGKTDEFVEPCTTDDFTPISNGDTVICVNFRPDRARQLASALADDNFNHFKREKLNINLVTLTSYRDDLKASVAFPPAVVTETLGELVSAADRTQFRIAETEKYAHVTYFLNGGREEPFTGEDRTLIPSPQVATYDLQPEMSAAEVTEKLVKAIQSGKYDFLCVNYANGDMVGHTGVLPAAIKAVEAIDQSLRQIHQALCEQDGLLMITADHGNCESMQDQTGGTHTAHTLNPVPAILVGPSKATLTKHDGTLADIAPSILQLLGLPTPSSMTGDPLFTL